MNTTTLNLNVGESKTLSIEWLTSAGIVTPIPGRNLSWRIVQPESVITIGQPADVLPGSWLVADTCRVTALIGGNASIIAAANFNPPERPFPKTEFATITITVVNPPVSGRIVVSD